MAMMDEFKKFAMRGNVMDLAVGIIIGAAFTAIVNSLVGDLINPIIGLLTVAMAVRGAWGDPTRPYWAVATTISVCLFISNRYPICYSIKIAVCFGVVYFSIFFYKISTSCRIYTNPFYSP